MTTLESTARTPIANEWPKGDNVLRLRDGRLLGYAEYGDPRHSWSFPNPVGTAAPGGVAHRRATSPNPSSLKVVR